MADRLAANLLAYAVQVGAIVVVAGALLRVFRIASPRVRLAVWQLVLVACLALPAVQPWPSAPAAIEAAPARVAADTGVSPPAAAEPPPPLAGHEVGRAFWRESSFIVAAIAAGIAGRLGWLAVGLVGLGRLRRQAHVADRSEGVFCDAIALTNSVADFRFSAGVLEPVTFGARRATVLLPDRFHEFSRAEQVAIVCHELLHVRRRDWLKTVADEIVRAVFWCHPAVWWMLDQIHLCREQVVDRRVVALIGERRPYLSALWRLASQPAGRALRPASAFLGRAHLTQRVALLVKEVPMSRLRLASSLVIMAIVLASGAAAIVRAFPLVVAPASPLVSAVLPDSPPLAPHDQPPPPPPPARPAPGRISAPPPPPTPALAVPRRTKNVDPLYPAVEAGFNRAADVTVSLTIDARGTVTSVEAVTGDEPFVTPAIDAARQWQFAPPWKAPLTVRYVVHFPALGDTQGKITSRLAGVVVSRTMPPPPPPPPPRSRSEPLSVKFHDASLRDVMTFISEVAGLEVRYADGVGLQGRAISIDLERVTVDAALREVVGRAGLTFRYEDPSTVVISAPEPDGAVRIGGAIKPPRKLVDVPAVYPDAARAADVQGVVIVEARIGTDGKVNDARVLRSIPLLDEAALAAVRQWEYQPTLLNGAPVEVIMTVTVPFPPR